jgi:hypothetical protein
MVEVLLDEGQILGADLLLELFNLMLHDLELALHLLNLILEIKNRHMKVGRSNSQLLTMADKNITELLCRLL